MKPLTRALPFCILLALPFPGQALAEAVGSVEALAGEAHGTPPGGVRRQLALAETLVQDEFVETQVGGGMTVAFLDGTEFRLGSNSSAMLDRFLYDPSAAGGDGVVQLGQGVFRFISGAGTEHDGVQVQTPNSVIGIRGTDFVVLIDRDAGTTVGTASGMIEVSTLRTGETFAVEPGKLGRIAPDGSVSLEEAPVPAGELACWLAQDSYVCIAEAGSGATAAPVGDDLGGPEGGTAEPSGPGPGPSDPGPNDPGDDAGNDPADPGPSDPGDDPGAGDPGGGPGDPGDGDPGGN